MAASCRLGHADAAWCHRFAARRCAVQSGAEASGSDRHARPVLVQMWRGRAIPGTDVAGWRWELLRRKRPSEISALCRDSPTCFRLPMSAAAQRGGRRARAQRSAQGCVCVLATADSRRRRLGAGVRLLAATRPFRCRTCRAACNGRGVVLRHAVLGMVMHATCQILVTCQAAVSIRLCAALSCTAGGSGRGRGSRSRSDR